MTTISPSSAAYTRYVLRGQRAIAASNIFPTEIAEVIRSYIAHTRPEFYHFVLKNGNVMGVLTRCDKILRCAFFADESLLSESEQKTVTEMSNRRPHIYEYISCYKELTIDNIFESNFFMAIRVSSKLDSCWWTKKKMNACNYIDIIASMRESFSREADLLTG